MSVEYTKYEFLHFSTLWKGLYVIDNWLFDYFYDLCEPNISSKCYVSL